MLNTVKDPLLFKLFHDYFKQYLPNQKKYSPHTIRSYRKAMDSLLDFVKERRNIQLPSITFEMLDKETILSFLDNIEKEQGCGISTRNHRLYCIRAFFTYAGKMEVTAVTFLDDIKKVPTKRVDKNNYVRHMSENAVKTLLAQPDLTTEKGLRDLCFMILLYDTGARVQEMVDIRLRDVRIGDPYIIILHGKGGKVRSIPITEKTAEHLKRYINVFHGGVSQVSDEYLFFTKCKGRRERMTEANVRSFMRIYGQSAQNTCTEIPKSVHPHLLRHSRAMHLYHHGMDLSLISQWLGHANYETTLVYAHADTEHKRKAIESATKSSGVITSDKDIERFIVDDELLLKRLCGLCD